VAVSNSDMQVAMMLHDQWYNSREKFLCAYVHAEIGAKRARSHMALIDLSYSPSKASTPFKVNKVSILTNEDFKTSLVAVLLPRMHADVQRIVRETRKVAGTQVVYAACFTCAEMPKLVKSASLPFAPDMQKYMPPPETLLTFINTSPLDGLTSAMAAMRSMNV